MPKSPKVKFMIGSKSGSSESLNTLNNITNDATKSNEVSKSANTVSSTTATNGVLNHPNFINGNNDEIQISPDSPDGVSKTNSFIRFEKCFIFVFISVSSFDLNHKCSLKIKPFILFFFNIETRKFALKF